MTLGHKAFEAAARAVFSAADDIVFCTSKISEDAVVVIAQWRYLDDQGAVTVAATAGGRDVRDASQAAALGRERAEQALRVLRQETAGLPREYDLAASA